jgi:hypothetical protein
MGHGYRIYAGLAVKTAAANTMTSANHAFFVIVAGCLVNTIVIPISEVARITRAIRHAFIIVVTKSMNL